MKLHMHYHTMVKYIQYQFHEMPSFGYLIIAEDGNTDGRADGKRQTYIPPPLAGDIKRIQHVLIKVIETVSPRFIVGN